MDTVSRPAAALAGRLARDAESVCRHYLSNGRRAGHYWQVGDVANHPGRSLYVRLTGPETGPGAAGHWTDAATGQHGDLLDLIGLACACATLRDAIAEARHFLGGVTAASVRRPPREAAPRGSIEAVRRLFAAAGPVAGTLAETYLRARGITVQPTPETLRFHPACWHRLSEDAPPERWPALLAAVTDTAGCITGLQRTWLARDGSAKAPLAEPRRAMGKLLGYGVRFGDADTILAVGEGIETMLSLRSVLPGLPCVAALSANHLAALVLPVNLQHLLIARDRDAAGLQASRRLEERALATGVAVSPLVPVSADFNDDLHTFGAEALRAQLCVKVDLIDGIQHRAEEFATTG